MRNSGIYEIANIINGHRYIGQAIDLDKRWRQHRGSLRHGKGINPILQNAWNKYGEAAFEFRVLAIIPPPFTKEELTAMEQYYVDRFEPAYNVCHECVTSQLGTKHSPEARAKISVAGKNRRCSPETRAKLSAALMGRKHSPEALVNMSIAQKGHKTSLETRAKMALAQTGKKRSPEHGAHISAALKGKKRGPMSPEHRANNSAAQKGKTLSEEHRAKISLANKGRKISPEVRAKISVALMGNTNGVGRGTSPEARAKKRAGLANCGIIE